MQSLDAAAQPDVLAKLTSIAEMDAFILGKPLPLPQISNSTSPRGFNRRRAPSAAYRGYAALRRSAGAVFTPTPEPPEPLWPLRLALSPNARHELQAIRDIQQSTPNPPPVFERLADPLKFTGAAKVVAQDPYHHHEPLGLAGGVVPGQHRHVDDECPKETKRQLSARQRPRAWEESLRPFSTSPVARRKERGWRSDRWAL